MNLEVELVAAFLESSASEFSKLSVAMKEGNLRDAEVFASNLDDASKYVGATTVRTLAVAIGRSCQDGHLDVAKAKVPLLEKALSDAIALMSAFLERHGDLN